jgi:IclR family pca regulon transcriptional regulator
MERQSELVHHPHSNEQIRTEDYIAGLAKGLALLEAFGIDRQRLNVTQVAERTGISRTAARRYLKTLKFWAIWKPMSIIFGSLIVYCVFLVLI